MKLQKVFGLVVGAHVAVLTVLLSTPGCRSTGKPKPKAEDTLASGPAASPGDLVEPTAVAPMSNEDINAGSPPPPVAVAPATPPPGDDLAVRFAPTRPAAAIEPVAPAPAEPARATHVVAKGDSLWSIARKYGVTVAEIAAANQLAPSATLRLGQSLAVPAKAAAAPGAAADATNTYVVKSGDTLGGIARRQGTTVAALRSANNLSGDALRIGQKLVVPGGAAPLPTAPAAVSAPAATPRAGSATHTVIPGDTLGSIARKAGVKVGEIALLNNITDPAKLRVGQVLKLPEGARTLPATPSAAPAPAVVTPAEPAPSPAAEAPTAVAPVAPVEAEVTPVEPMAVPVIRID